MRFFNNTTLDDIINNEVTVMLVASPGSNDIEAVEFCRVFVKDGEPHIDFARHAPGDYVAPLPGDAIVSRNETELAMGRYAVILSRQSEAGRMLVKLLGEK